jgi:cytoskeleton protein RodZ
MRGARSQDHDPAQNLMREVGAQLRQARLERGEDLNDVAQHLRIRSSYLFGIEQGDLSAMPGRPYALGFLRSYADYLGFDGEDLITRIKSTVENLTDRTSLRIRAPMPENRLPATPVVVISLAVVAGIYAGWSYLNRSSQMVVDTVAEVPSDLRARTIEAVPRDSGEVPPAPAEGTDGAAAPEMASGADPSGAAAAARDPAAPTVASATDAAPREAMPGATGDAAAPAQRPGAAPDRVAAPEAGPSVDGRTSVAQGIAPEALAVQPAAGAGSSHGRAQPGTPPSTARIANDQSGAAAAAAGSEIAAATDPARHGDARVVLRARERTWIRVSSLAGDYVFTRTLEPGEAFVVPDRSGLELWTGNAGGLEVTVDGTPVRALAGAGAVRRHVSLDPDRLLEAAQQAR